MTILNFLTITPFGLTILIGVIVILLTSVLITVARGELSFRGNVDNIKYYIVFNGEGYFVVEEDEIIDEYEVINYYHDEFRAYSVAADLNVGM